MPQNGHAADDGLVLDLARHLRGRTSSLETLIATLADQLGGLANSIAGYINSYPFITPTDNPTIPPEGRAATYLVSPSVTWPANLMWSVDPDRSSAPTLSGNAMVTMFTVGGATHAIVGALFPRSKRPDTLYSITVKADNPVAYWRLDETSGNRALEDTANYDGIYGGDPTLGVDSLLRNNGGTAVSYPDRTNNANKVAVNHAVQLNAFGAFSIEMWVKLADANPDATQQLLDKTGMASANGQYGVMYDNRSSQGSPKRLRAQIAGAQVDWPNAHTALAAGGHLVVTVSGSGSGQSIIMYWNGEIVASNSNATVNWSSANELPLNMCARGGVTDEVALYHRALTAAQVAVHYAAR